MPLNKFFEDERDRRKTLQQKAQKALADAQSAVAAARTAQEKKGADVAAKLREIADLRRRIAAAPMPADMDKLVKELRAALIALRALRSELLAAQEARARAETDEERARPESQAAAASLAEAGQAVIRETERQKRHDAQIDLLAKEPLASMTKRATDALASPLFKDAEATVGAIPKELRERALARLDQELERQGEEQTGATVAEDGLAQVAASEAARAWETFRRAEASLAAWVSGAPARLDQALGLLERAKGASLTAEEKQHLTDIAAKAAVDLERDRDIALEKRDKAAAALEAKEVEIRTANIDEKPGDNKDYQDLDSKLKDAKKELKEAEDLFTQLDRHALEAWEAAVPDPVWDGLTAFDQARRILEGLKKGPGDRVKKLDDAETPLVDALAKELKRGRTIDFLRARAELLRGRLLHADNLREPRIARAVRGDA